MKSLQKPEQPSFTFAKMSGAFIRGMFAGRPLVEVARAGLGHDTGEGRLVAYANRIRRAKDSESAFLALKEGVRSKAAERILASAVRDPDASFALLIGGCVISAEAETILAKNLASEDSGFPSYMLLKLQTVRSHEAQEALANALNAGGLSERAAELLLSGSVGSETAQKKISSIVPRDPKTILKIFLSGNIARDAATELSKRLPPVCVPIDGCMPAE